MPESKNNFIQAKMNQDLDDRLVPNGQYRVGQNVVISRSEGDDVGTFQNVLGNELLSSFNFDNINNLEVIGYTYNETSDDVFAFLTNYTDSSQDQLSNFSTGQVTSCIIKYNISSQNSVLLVEGSFLNFSKTHPILGISIIEDLLFWTDNRNQPRKININKAQSNNYLYNSEDKISVAKIYPYQCIDYFNENEKTISQVSGVNLILNNVDGLEVGMSVIYTAGAASPQNNLELYIVSINTSSKTVTLNKSTVFSQGDTAFFIKYGLKNCGEEWLPTEYVGKLTVVNSTLGTYNIEKNAGNDPNIDSGGVMYVASVGESLLIKKEEKWKITNVSANEITISNPVGDAPPNLNNTRVTIYRKNPNYDSTFAGDKNFLKDKFVRFSYRFKFDDNEYSLMAPFSQTAFIPLNFGSFVDSNEVDAAKSSVLKFWENWVDCIDLTIKTPFNDTWRQAVDSLNITQLQIVCKFSDESTIKVIDNLNIESILKYSTLQGSIETNKVLYPYKSQKPIRTLPEKEITRVYDQTPVRAFSQETAGNRVIYGNFYDKHTSPDFLDYKVSVSSKLDNSTNRSQYNHNLKQNRTYQVGIVLSDRYGRQSDVILSSVQDSITVDGVTFGGATTFNRYSDLNKFSAETIERWFGDQIILYLDSAIPNSINKEGYPGLYSTTNPIGWYTYKVVVKQQEQEYYNVYLPSCISENSSGVSYNFNESYASLFSDNINKVPKDMSNVGPEDKEFRSSTLLFPRVNPKLPFASTDLNSTFYETSSKANIVDSIFNNIVSTSATTTGTPSFSSTSSVSYEYLYKGKTALTAVLNNNKEYGTEISYLQSGNPLSPDTAKITDSHNNLAVLETKPTFSNLDIYYETSTSGLINDINGQISSGNLGPVGLTDVSATTILRESTYLYDEGTNPPATITGDVLCTLEVKNYLGVTILDPTATCDLSFVWSSTLGSNNNLSSYFKVVQQLDALNQPTGRFKLYNQLGQFYYGLDGMNLNFTFSITANTFNNPNINLSIPLSNQKPQGREKNILIPQFNSQDIFPFVTPSILCQYKNLNLQTKEVTYSGVTYPSEDLRPYNYPTDGGNNLSTTRADPTQPSVQPVIGTSTLFNPTINNSLQSPLFFISLDPYGGLLTTEEGPITTRNNGVGSIDQDFTVWRYLNTGVNRAPLPEISFGASGYVSNPISDDEYIGRLIATSCFAPPYTYSTGNGWRIPAGNNWNERNVSLDYIPRNYPSYLNPPDQSKSYFPNVLSPNLNYALVNFVSEKQSDWEGDTTGSAAKGSGRFWKIPVLQKDLTKWSNLDGDFGFLNGCLQDVGVFSQGSVQPVCRFDLTYSIDKTTFRIDDSNTVINTTAAQDGLAECFYLDPVNPGRIITDDAKLWEYFGDPDGISNGASSDGGTITPVLYRRPQPNPLVNLPDGRPNYEMHVYFDLKVEDANGNGSGFISTFTMLYFIIA